MLQIQKECVFMYLYKRLEKEKKEKYNPLKNNNTYVLTTHRYYFINLFV